MFAKILEAIAAYDTIILHRHSSPDGDALGSQIGLKNLLQDNYPNKTVYAVGDDAGRYAFMAGSTMDVIPDSAYEGALAIILDLSARKLISDSRWEKAAQTVRIDHHLFVEKIAQIEVQDSSFESCCGLVVALAVEAGWQISLAAATALYTGMITDSGRFRYDSTGSETFERAAILMRQPIDTAEIYRNLYANDFEQVLLRAKFIQRIRFTEHNVAYVYTSREEADALGVDDFSLSRGMVNAMSDIRGVDIWANFTQTNSGVLCELRSSRYNINPVAVKYGGGGHTKASGATLRDYAQVQQMLADLDAMMLGGEEG